MKPIVNRRWRWLRLGLLVGLYIMLISCGHIADRLLLFPSTAPIKSPGTESRTIPFEGGTLEVWTARSPGAAHRAPEAFTLRFVGNADRAEYWASDDARAWGAKSVEVWAVNYPGYGGSSGSARLSAMARSGLAAYDALRAVAGQRPIFVQAMSIGTTVALHVAANRPVAGLTLHNPPPLRSIILGDHGWWNLWLLAGPVALGVPSDLDSLANAKRTTAPAVFILADHDEIVPPKYQRRVVDAYAGPKREITIRDGTHNSALDPDSQAGLAKGLDWLWEQAGLK